MKKEARVIGIDDSPFKKGQRKDVLVIGTIYRGGSFMDGVVSTKIRPDGTNSTNKLVEMINRCRFRKQLYVILLDGIALGGFNVVDVVKLHKKTRIPVIVVMRNYPDFPRIISVLKRLGMKNKIALLKKAGEIHKIGKIHVQLSGISLKDAQKVMKMTCTRSFLPEPIRAAHLISAGVVKGESKGRA